MNTRQKLTLGIAAIFMVTLTVIGVTYAYFVTRIRYTGTETSANIVTAQIGAGYQDDAATIVINDALPGQEVYKTFAVNNSNEADVPVFITLTSALNTVEFGTCSDSSKTDRKSCVNAEGTWTPGICEGATGATKEACEGNHGTWKTEEILHQFVHADDTFETGQDLTSTCYVSSAYKDGISYTDGIATTPAHCFDGKKYDNILVELYRIDGYTGTADEFVDIDVTKDSFDNWTGVTKTPISTTGSGENEELKTYEAPYNSGLVAEISPTDESYYDKTLYLNREDGKLAETVKGITGNQEVSSNFYVIRVIYQNVNKNQNIENNASVVLRVNITATGPKAAE